MVTTKQKLAILTGVCAGLIGVAGWGARTYHEFLVHEFTTIKVEAHATGYHVAEIDKNTAVAIERLNSLQRTVEETALIVRRLDGKNFVALSTNWPIRLLP